VPDNAEVESKTLQENKMSIQTTYAPSTRSLKKYKGNLRAKGEDILVTNMYFGEEKTAGGIIVANDDGVERGIKPRWCQVYSIGPFSKLKDEINIGDWIMLEHGRWSRAVMIEDDEGVEWAIRKADIEAILVVSEDEPGEVQEWVGLQEDKTKILKDALEERKKEDPNARSDGRRILNGRRKGE